MIKRYFIDARVIGIGQPVTKTNKEGKEYSYALVHFLASSKYTTGEYPISCYLYDYADLKVGNKVSLEAITCGKERAYFLA